MIDLVAFYPLPLCGEHLLVRRSPSLDPLTGPHGVSTLGTRKSLRPHRSPRSESFSARRRASLSSPLLCCDLRDAGAIEASGPTRGFFAKTSGVPRRSHKAISSCSPMPLLMSLRGLFFCSPYKAVSLGALFRASCRMLSKASGAAPPTLSRCDHRVQTGLTASVLLCVQAGGSSKSELKGTSQLRDILSLATYFGRFETADSRFDLACGPPNRDSHEGRRRRSTAPPEGLGAPVRRIFLTTAELFQLSPVSADRPPLPRPRTKVWYASYAEDDDGLSVRQQLRRAPSDSKFLSSSWARRTFLHPKPYYFPLRPRHGTPRTRHFFQVANVNPSRSTIPFCSRSFPRARLSRGQAPRQEAKLGGVGEPHSLPGLWVLQCEVKWL